MAPTPKNMPNLPAFLRQPNRYDLQRERRRFRELMPFLLLASLVGLLVAASALMDFSIQGLWHPVAIAAGIAVALVPLPVLVYRFLRGHYAPRD